MYAMLFTIVFQGLAFLALLYVVIAVVVRMAVLPTPVSQFLSKLLSPFLTSAAVITPAIIPRALLPFMAAIWLLVLRVGFYMGAGAYGLLPAVTPS
jgi:hypothetical protein